MAHLKMLLCCQPTFNVPSFLKTLFVISAQFGPFFLKYVELSLLSYIYSFYKHTCSSTINQLIYLKAAKCVIPKSVLPKCEANLLF